MAENEKWIVRKKIRICDDNHKKNVCEGQEERACGELKENGIE